MSTGFSVIFTRVSIRLKITNFVILRKLVCLSEPQSPCLCHINLNRKFLGKLQVKFSGGSHFLVNGGYRSCCKGPDRGRGWWLPPDNACNRAEVGWPGLTVPFPCLLMAAQEEHSACQIITAGSLLKMY